MIITVLTVVTIYCFLHGLLGDCNNIERKNIMCRWCRKDTMLMPQESGVLIPMICSECGGQIDYWNWKDLTVKLTRRNNYKHKLLDLLATIHKDGGQYTQKVGLEKSTDDAMEIISKTVVKNNQRSQQ